MGNYIFLGLVLASFFGLAKLFEKAGEKGWKGWIPVYNFYVLAKLLKKPWWWCLIMIVPGVNILMYGVYGFNVARAFNKPDNASLLFGAILPYIFFVKVGLDDTARFVGLEKYKREPSRFIRNWVDPIIFAVIAASIIRGYFIEAFTIPTSSLEKSLMVGDFLFVNKFAYGPKIPQTPLSFPFAHSTLPLSDTKKSYLRVDQAALFPPSRLRKREK
jgi:signal peptidase I